MSARTRKGLTCGVTDGPDYICRNPKDPTLWTLREFARVMFAEKNSPAAANGEYPPEIGLTSYDTL